MEDEFLKAQEGSVTRNCFRKVKYDFFFTICIISSILLFKKRNIQETGLDSIVQEFNKDRNQDFSIGRTNAISDLVILSFNEPSALTASLISQKLGAYKNVHFYITDNLDPNNFLTDSPRC